MICVYGIANCDTVRKARRWLGERDIAHRFHDFRRDGLEEAMVAHWVAVLGWEALLNKRGTTFRTLPDSDKQALDAGLDTDRAADKARALMVAHPTLIKRPVVADGEIILVGFDSMAWEKHFTADT